MCETHGVTDCKVKSFDWERENVSGESFEGAWWAPTEESTAVWPRYCKFLQMHEIYSGEEWDWKCQNGNCESFDKASW